MTSCCVRIEVFSDSRKCITIDQRTFLSQKHGKCYVFFFMQTDTKLEHKKTRTNCLKDKIGNQRLFTDPPCPFDTRIKQKKDGKINQQSPIEV